MTRPVPHLPSAEPVTVRYRGQALAESPGTRLHMVIRARGLHPELTVAVVNGMVAREDVVLRAGDHVTLVPVMSGG